MGFDGKRVLALESRRATETAELIRRNGGVPFLAPSMREVPIEENAAAFRFAKDLAAGRFDMAIFLTGVGTRYLVKVVGTGIVDELRKIIVVARGPKPVAALRELGVQINVMVPEPNTWRELLAALEGRTEKRVAVQLYGRRADELIEGLRARGAEVTEVPVYQWALPEDLGPLREAVRLLGESVFDVTMWTTSQQVVHVMDVAREMGVDVAPGIRRSLIASIGPTTSEMLREYGFEPSMEPTHAKLGFLVKEAAER